MRKRNIRKLPEQKDRVETGAIQFGDDWPGLFVRGDDSFSLMCFLIQSVKEGRLAPFDSSYYLIDIINEHVHSRPQAKKADYEWAARVLDEMEEAGEPEEHR
jgi:hypothetical protein